MKSGAVAPATPPRADRLRFVGQADLEASALQARIIVWHRAQSYAEFTDALERHASSLRALATDKERI